MSNAFDMIITTPLGYVISFIYTLVKNYGVTIILFTIITKMILIPLAVKQQKSMVEMQKLKPLLDVINKKYSNDKERLNQETMKLYKEHKVNPAGGCLPMLIQLPIIFGLYQVITKPLQYIMHLSLPVIAQITELLGLSNTGTSQIAIAQRMSEKLQELSSQVGVELFPMNFNFLGLDLSLTPDLKVLNFLWIIPIVSAATAYMTGVLSSRMSGAGNEQAAQQMKTMNTIMPLMSGYFCFIMPAGVGLYWIMSNVVQMLQQLVLNKILLKRQGEVDPIDVREFEKKQNNNNRKKR